MPDEAETRISLMPGGTRNGVGGLSFSACFRKSRAMGRGETATGGAVPQRARLVEADIDADRQVRREAHEPRILGVVRGAGLAGQRLADLLQDGGGAALDHALHDGGHLVGGERIEHLLRIVHELRLVLARPLVGVTAQALAVVVLVDGLADPVLDAVDQGRADAPAAIGQHRVGGDHAHHRGLARTQRHRQHGEHVVVDAEAGGHIPAISGMPTSLASRTVIRFFECSMP